MIFENITIKQIKNMDKNIFCFGAGRAFDSFMELFVDFHLEDNVKAVVDNRAKDIETTVKVVNGVCIPIISIDQMLRRIKAGDRILITTLAFDEVVQQLEQISELKFVKYCLYFVLSMELQDRARLQIEMPTCLSTCNDYVIPKTIHYCWFGGQEIPNRYKKYMESWKRYCPDYEIIEWNESNYDVHKNRYSSEAYELKKWAFVSDYARVDIINKYGGVYLDTDVELIKNIDEMLKNEAFCGFESNEYVAYGLGFGARKKHPIIGEIKDYYDGARFVLDNGQIDQTTCPVIQTEIMKKHGLICNGEFQVVDGMVVYPERILCGMSLHSYRVERNPVYTYAIHHYAGSWLDVDIEKMKKISYMKKKGEDAFYVYPE